MDLAGIGGLLVGLAALITAIGSWRKAKDAESAISELRVQITQLTNQQATVNQSPVLNVNPVFNVTLPATTPATAETVGEAQVNASPSLDLLPPAQPAPTQPSALGPAPEESES